MKVLTFGTASSGLGRHSPGGRSRPRIARLLALVAAAALASASITAAALAAPAQPQVVVAGGDWTQFRHDTNSSGYNPGENVLSVSNAAALGVAWKGAINPTGAATYRIIESSPAVANGVVYVGSRNSGELFAYPVGCGSDGAICTPLWTASTDNWWISSSPAVYNGVVYVGGAGPNGHLYAFDAAGNTNCSGTPKTCSPLWTGQTGAAITGSPAVYNGVVYVGSNDDKLYAYNAAACAAAGGSCSPIWTGPTTGAIHSSPAVAPPVAGGNPVVYIASDDGKLYAWDAVACATAGGSCVPLWTAHPTGGVLYSPVVANGVVYIADGSWYIDAYDAAGGTAHCSGSPKTCTPLWSHSSGEGVASAPAVANGVIYEMGTASHFCAFAAAVFTEVWCADYTGDIRSTSLSSPAVANGVVYVADGSGKLLVYDAAGVVGYGSSSVAPLWSYTAGAAIEDSPAVSNGVVYVGSDDGYLYAFDLTHGATYHAITPARVLDTRNGTGGLSAPFTNHVARTFTVTGGSSGVPSGATAVTGNLTVTGQTSSGYLFIGPVAANNPTSSTLNFPVGDDRANAVTVALGAGGKLSITFVAPSNGPTAHAIFDVTGYFTPDTSGATYHPLAPKRLLDTRNGTGGLPGPFTNHVARTFGVTGGSSGVPSGATAVTGNLTVTGQTSSGYLFIGPVAANNPTSSTLNFPVGDDRANAVTVALGAGGTLSITFVAPSNGPSAHAIFDVTGYFTADTSGLTYIPLSPTRILDTRNGTGMSGALSSHGARSFGATGLAGVPSYGVAVTGNLTVTAQTSSGYLYLGPAPMNDPTSSTLNFPVGDDRANAVTVGTGGTLSVTFVAPAPGPTAHAIFDVTGFFVP
jgi:outer membrane protein assembly factor BamB